MYISSFLDQLSGEVEFQQNNSKLIDIVLDRDCLSITETSKLSNEKLHQGLGELPAFSHPLKTMKAASPGENSYLNGQSNIFNRLLDHLYPMFSSTYCTTLVIELALLGTFIPTFCFYTASYVWGPVLPMCTLFPQVGNLIPTEEKYWMGLKVIEKECVMSQLAWYSSTAFM
jgi:hypothetical protein